MLCTRSSRPSLLLVAAGLLVPSRGIAVCGAAAAAASARASVLFLAPPGSLPPASAARQGQREQRSSRLPRCTKKTFAPPASYSSSRTVDGAGEGSMRLRSELSCTRRQGVAVGGGDDDGGDGGIGAGGGVEGRKMGDEERGVERRSSPTRAPPVPASAVPDRQRRRQQQQVRIRRHRGSQGGGWGGDGDGMDGDDSGMSPADRERETQAVEGAVAFAAAKRGTGERERLVASESPVEEFIVRGRRILVKRDDKMRLADSGLSGNKARKLYALNRTPADSFPRVVASHGGPQSNAMVAIAAVVASKPGSSFVYYTKPVPRWLRKNPVGNFARTLALGAEIMEVHTDDYKRIFGGADGPGASYSEVVPKEALFLPQGGADAAAEEGVSMLAKEIIEYWHDHGPPGKELRVILPAGTGTTALFLARHLVPEGIPVFTFPCAGDSAYMYRQMAKVDRASGGVGTFPQVVDQTKKKAAFGVPKREFLDVWRELDQAGLFVDLLYACPTWEVIMSSWDEPGSPVYVSPGPPVDSEPQLMYVHCGGLEGVSSQLTRYKHQGLVQDGQLLQ